MSKGHLFIPKKWLEEKFNKLNSKLTSEIVESATHYTVTKNADTIQLAFQGLLIDDIPSLSKYIPLNKKGIYPCYSWDGTKYNPVIFQYYNNGWRVVNLSNAQQSSFNLFGSISFTIE